MVTAPASEQWSKDHLLGCWLIGKFECDYGDHATFSPTIFLHGPAHLYEFQRKVSASASAVSSGRSTWRKLEKYVQSLE